MKLITKFSPKLIAPCGMNCAVCRGYLTYTHNIPRGKGGPRCIGCRPRKKLCAFLKGQCVLIRENKIQFCYQCQKFPCRRLLVLDQRYRTKYHTSFVSNLKTIKKIGLSKWIKSQEKKWRCQNCGGVVCVHDRKCYDCGN